MQPILDGSKCTTWRIFDEKDIRQDDELTFLEFETRKEFAKATVLAVRETRLGALTASDWEGHERFDSEEQMYRVYEKYYGRTVTADSPVKIIKFKIKE